MLDLAIKQSRDCLQAGMRMRPNLHAGGATDILGAVMIKKAPGADHPDLLVGQRARNFGRLSERDPASRQQQLFRPTGESTTAEILLRSGIKITQVPRTFLICQDLPASQRWISTLTSCSHVPTPSSLACRPESITPLQPQAPAVVGANSSSQCTEAIGR
jgi:hypothetical protein